MTVNASLTIGIEEEYLLVDPVSRDLLKDPPPAFMEECTDQLGDLVTAEFLRSQVEIGTPVCQSVKEARHHLIELRSTLCRTAERHGMRLFAASTHPSAHWVEQAHTPKKRYDELAADLQGTIRRLLICGMHVHIGIEDADARIDVMNQAKYFLPHILALTTSSPFWHGNKMGLHSYRLSVFDGMPRTGIPDTFESWAEYQRLLDRLIESELIEDASKIWWDLRPSSRYPTLEIRIADVCTRLEDALTVAALYQCIVRMLMRLRRQNLRWRVYPRVMVRENRWLAQRWGETGNLLDLGKGQQVPYGTLLEEIFNMVREDAEALDCVAELEHAHTILARGTSATRQLAVYDAAITAGVTPAEALRQVVDHILEETVADLPGHTGPGHSEGTN
jgi:carboxylate-amine ligase